MRLELLNLGLFLLAIGKLALVTGIGPSVLAAIALEARMCGRIPPAPAPAPACVIPRVAVLDSPVEFMRWCDVCENLERFTAAWQCEAGLVGACLGCGDERVLPFSRTTVAA